MDYTNTDAITFELYRLLCATRANPMSVPAPDERQYYKSIDKNTRRNNALVVKYYAGYISFAAGEMLRTGLP